LTIARAFPKLFRITCTIQLVERTDDPDNFGEGSHYGQAKSAPNLHPIFSENSRRGAALTQRPPGACGAIGKLSLVDPACFMRRFIVTEKDFCQSRNYTFAS
jgi:hypothetical protein